MNYTLIRSQRKTVSIRILTDGSLLVRAPMRLSKKAIDQFVDAKANWIQKHTLPVGDIDKLSPEELSMLTQKAKELIPVRVSLWAERMGISCGTISIRHQKTRWGSCSSQGNLNFNCLLLLAPPEVLDSVIVHELAHRLEMNHSQRFYAIVYRFFPDYDKYNRWLKANGGHLIAKLP